METDHKSIPPVIIFLKFFNLIYSTTPKATHIYSFFYYMSSSDLPMKSQSCTKNLVPKHVTKIVVNSISSKFS